MASYRVSWVALVLLFSFAWRCIGSANDCAGSCNTSVDLCQTRTDTSDESDGAGGVDHASSRVNLAEANRAADSPLASSGSSDAHASSSGPSSSSDGGMMIDFSLMLFTVEGNQGAESVDSPASSEVARATIDGETIVPVESKPCNDVNTVEDSGASRTIDPPETTASNVEDSGASRTINPAETTASNDVNTVEDSGASRTIDPPETTANNDVNLVEDSGASRTIDPPETTANNDINRVEESSLSEQARQGTIDPAETTSSNDINNGEDSGASQDTEATDAGTRLVIQDVVDVIRRIWFRRNDDGELCCLDSPQDVLEFLEFLQSLTPQNLRE
ncbi:dentin sialophosphoprotein isoform X2 [Selaginella moellendorffii]|uniref:dentin sialophosphoprotein isoform X2 n=1 Tax=Selaginella moellendorffii TaxID=88036 RepID=UPI000D1CF128|nr:dentin sialophosphoprotein isoform X2 [Selaginella moellendorffii]|eukprot:XP_024545594.1 dentin sialophosphoprotein isoform X2 [Selaginella moellendorffii]